MNILFFTDLGHPAVEDLIRWFRNRGHTVSILSLQPPPKGHKPNIQKNIPKYRILTNRKLKRINIAPQRIISKTRKIIAKVKPDIVHAFFATYYGWLAYLSWFKPYIITVMNADINFFNSFTRKQKLLTLLSFENADGIISVSEDIKQRIRRLGVRGPSHRIILPGADTEIFKPRKNNQSLMRTLKITGHRSVILSPRAFNRIYNIASIVKAIPSVLAKYPDTIFLFTSYRLNNNSYKCVLRNLVRTLNIDHAVRFLCVQNRKLMSDIYNISRCMISIPSADGTPASIHEGMACGTIPIVSSLPTTDIWIKNGINGIVIKKNNSYHVSRAIIQVLREKPEKIKKIARINRDIIRKKAEFSSWRKKEQDFYKLVCSKNYHTTAC